MSRQLLAVAYALHDLQAKEVDKSLARAMGCKAISACYYAAFNAISALIAHSFELKIGRDIAATRWRQVFRSLDHSRVVKVAGRIQSEAKLITKKSKEPRRAQTKLEIWADNIVMLQQRRHEADYDPSYWPSNSEVAAILRLAEDTLSLLDNLDKKDTAKLAVDLAFPPRVNT